MSDLLSKLVSPHGFDGMADVPGDVVAACKRTAELRVKFLHQWHPGLESPLTTREVEELFTASATVAEWLREVTEARDALVAEVKRLRAVEAAALDWDTADRGLEAMPCRDAAELLHRRRLAVHALRLALHPQEQSHE
jgi:hypothetical protein